MSVAEALRATRLPKPDGALVALIVILLGLALFARDQLAPSIGFTVDAFLGVLPFLLVSVALAAGAKASGADALIARAFVGREVQMITFAALIGALSPFCSCGVIPVIAALLSMGVPLAPVMAFWLASPIMDPTMFVLTLGTLGLDFALAKTAAAIGVGLLGGYGTYALTRSHKPVVWRFWGDDSRLAKFSRASFDTLLFLGKWLALAFLLESLMLAYVPAEAVRALVGDGGFLSILAATLVGVPAYLNGYAALPLVGGFIGQGMAPGAGMAFLVAGGITSIPAAIAVWALAKKQVFALYILFALAGSLLSGVLFQLAVA